MSELVGKPAPDFALEGVLHGKFDKYSLVKGKWNILLFYPLDFTFVCPTEVIAFSKHFAEFEKLGAVVYGVSVDSKFAHLAWTNTPEKQGGVGDINYPLLADLNKEVAKAYRVESGGVALRGLFIIDDEGVVQSAIINNLSVGRSVAETLRLLKAFQFTKSHGEVCPADWDEGGDTMKPNPDGLKDYAAKH